MAAGGFNLCGRDPRVHGNDRQRNGVEGGISLS
jgi:hypothetical protein